MDVSSLFGHLLLDGVVHRGDRRRRCRGSGGSYWLWWDVGLACGCWWLPGWDEGLPGGNWRLVCRRGNPLWRQRCLGRGCGCCWFGDEGEDSPWSHWWAVGSGGDGCSGSGPPLIQVWDVVVMIWRQLAWSRGVNNHLRNGWKNKRMEMERWNMST